jgi:hypothetical protein
LAQDRSMMAGSSDELAKSSVACSEQVRIELSRYRTAGAVRWAKTEQEACLLYLRNATGRAKITTSGGVADHILAGRASFCFLPRGVAAEGELEVGSVNGYAGVFVELNTACCPSG